ncbi:MAG: oxidoreductase [Candidatus Poribacteria bacterium]|nr:MAG: oxidoreductase [Candidatus Poribacteria bacterium]
MAEEKKQFRVIGTRPIRHDGTDKVTGYARYGADIHLSGMLYGKVLRSPHAHAVIKRIDTSKAEALPGVMAVITGRDLPEVADRLEELGEQVTNIRDESHNVLATGKVLYHGHAVAAVAAVSPHVAEEALKLIEVEYEVLEPVLDVLEAMKPDAPLLNPNLRTRGIGEEDGKPSNIAQHFQNKHGDVEKGFAEADYVVEREFRTTMVHQGYIEPQNATAYVRPDGSVTIWCSTQGAFAVRSQVAQLCKIPVSKIKVVPMEIGGGFGGKTVVYLEPLAVLLSKKTGRPVKMWMNRAEVLQATGPTSGSVIRVKMGCKKDGTLTAAQATLIYEAGAFPGSPVGAGAGVIFAPYRLPNVQIDGYDVLVNKPKTGAYRAPGGTNAAFAAESVVDELARLCGMDPLEFRLKNGVKEGDRRADGPRLPRVGYLETVRAAMESDHYKTPLEPSPDPTKRRGRGVASGFWFNGGGPSSVLVKVNEDGTVDLIEGSTDIGGTRASCAMIVAEVLGLPAEDVHPHVVDTDSIGYTSVTGGSSVTHKTGWASYLAAQEVREEVIRRAALLWSVEPAEVEYHDDGTLTCKSDPSKKTTFKEIAAQMNRTGGPIEGKGTINAGGAGPGFGTHIVDVEVDIETGKVDILRYTAVQDVGRAIHPAYVEGQIEGGVAQGAGWALTEEYYYDEKGHLLNSSLLDYRMPTALDLPLIETILVEVPNPNHPLGVRGVGETPIVPPAGAIANAIYDAVGIRLTRLPMKPSYVLEELIKAGLTS